MLSPIQPPWNFIPIVKCFKSLLGSAWQMANGNPSQRGRQWQTSKCTDGLCRTADATAAFPLQYQYYFTWTILTTLFYDFLFSLYSWHPRDICDICDTMLRYLWNRGQNPGSEREKLQKELFSFSKNVQYGFPHKPVAMDWDPHLKEGSSWPDHTLTIYSSRLKLLFK